MNGSFVDGSTLVITFAPRATDTDAVWGQTPLNKLGYSVLCFVDFADAWFPSVDMMELRTRANDLLGSYSRIVTYGHSMGGYGALKYGRLFSASRSVGLGPAWSVVPEDVETFDKRRPRLFYRKNLHQMMSIKPEDLVDDAVVVFDPHHVEDSAHLRAMVQAGCRVSKLRNYFVGHDLLSPCIDSGNASRFLREIVEGSGAQGLRNIIRSSRGGSPRYVAKALTHTYRTKRTTFNRRIAEKYGLPLVENETVRAVLARQRHPLPAHLKASADPNGSLRKPSSETLLAADELEAIISRRDGNAARRWLEIYADGRKFEQLDDMSARLIAEPQWPGDEYITFASAVMKGGRSEAHYQIIDRLLNAATGRRHTASKLAKMLMGPDIVLRREATVPPSFFSSAHYVEGSDSAAFLMPSDRGEFMRSLVIDLPPGALEITFNVQADAETLKCLSIDALGKTGHSIQSYSRNGMSFLFGKAWRRLLSKTDAAAPSIKVRVPEPRKGTDPRVSIILKSNGARAGTPVRFNGVQITRLGSWAR